MSNLQLKHDKLVEILEETLHLAIVRSPMFEVIQNTLAIASDIPEERLTLWLEIIEKLKGRIHENYKVSGLVSMRTDS